MTTPKYFYVIIGGGLAGLQLARQLSREIFFKGKAIALIDPSFQAPSQTWCFWEEGNQKWSSLVHHSWQTGRFIAQDVNTKLELLPYSYNMIRAKDFYTAFVEELEASQDVTLIKDEISKIDPVTMKAIGNKKDYTATHFFDSRVNPGYLESKKHTLIYQHFKGILIETEKAQFDPSEFTMMDYRLKYKDATAFTYVLPISEKKALIEYTFFTPFLTEDKVYDEFLQNYITKILKIRDYKIAETETGIIPMTDFPFEKENTGKITKIGTGGAWVKASTGYSFKNTEKYISKLIWNIKSGRIPGYKLINKRFRFYDAIFLDVLATNNHHGEAIFTKFYTKNSPQEIFKYLDEETTFQEEISIMLSLFSFDFIKSFFKKLF